MWSNATTSFNEKIQEYSRTFKARLVLADASTIDISTLTYTNGITGADTFTLGGAVSSMITGTIVGDFGKSLKGQEVTLQIGLEVTPEQFEYIPMGIYKITSSPALDGGGVSFTAYDSMYYKYSTAYTPTSGLGETITETSTDEEGNEVVTTTTLATIGQVLADIETQLGIIIINNSCNTALMTSKVKVLGGYYIAETLGYLASALGGFVYVDRAGVVTIAPLGSRGSFQIDGDRYYSLTKGEENTVIDGVIVSTGGNDYQYGRGARVALSNPILLEASAEAMANAIIGTEYRPVTVSFLGDVRLDANDTLTIITPSGENYTTPIMQITHTFDGGITTTVTSLEVNEVESEVGFTGSVTQQLERTQTELLDTKTLVAQKADIKELNVVKGTIEELDAKIIHTGELIADKATIGELNVVKADIKELNTNLIKTNEIVANKATIGELNATKADIKELNSNLIKTNELVATKASITELNTAKADIKVLEADSAKINSLIFGNAVGGTISVDFATAIVGAFQNGIIKSAMIESLAVEKISGGTISTKKFRVASDDGNLAIADNTIQIKDGTRVRIQIGKDSTGDYNLGLWDANGKKLWDAKGITSDAIRDGLIDNDMINSNANISGDKLNLPSLVKEINDSTETIKASHILYDPTKQTLDIAFQSMSQEVGELSGNVSTLQTNHSVMNGQIKTVISATETLDRELDTVANDVATAQSTANTAKSTADSAKSTANNANTTASNANKTATTANDTANTAKNTADSAKSTATTAQNTANTAKNTADTAKSTADSAKNTATSALTRVTSVETSLNGFKTQVSETYTTKTDFNNLQIGGTNLAKDTGNPAVNITSTDNTGNSTWEVESCKKYWHDHIIRLETGQEYTLSFNYSMDWSGVATGRTDNVGCGIGAYLKSSNTYDADVFDSQATYKRFGGSVDRGKFVYKFKYNLSDERYFAFRPLRCVQGGINGLKITISNFKLEKGNKVTDWSPSPQDVNASIATVDGKFTNYTTTADLNSKLTQTKNEISTEVSGTYTTKAEYTTGIADVNKKFGSYTTTADLNTKLTQTKEQIKLEASETYTTKADFNDLQVGGRNLIRNSDNLGAGTTSVGITSVKNPDKTITVTTTASNGNWHSFGIENSEEINAQFKTGDTFTISFTMKSSNTTKVPRVYIKSGMGYFPMVGTLSPTYSTVYYTGKWVAPNSIQLHLGWSGIEGTVVIKNVKIEKGDKATDWTPAPEDTESTISTLRSSITANANAIELKVSKGDIISSINQTAESVKINASKVDLQGYVTVSALSGSGTTTINGANIKTGAIQSSNYVANSTGTKINLSDGTIDTKGFKVNSAGVATLTGATLTNVDLKFTSDGEDVGRIRSYAGGGGFPTLSISGQYGLDLSSSRSVKISGGNVSITGDTNISSLTVNNELNTNKIRIVSGSDASETSTGHGLQIGADNTSNIRIDPNEIVVCNNGALSEFYLNAKSIGLHANVNCNGILQSTGGDVRVKKGDNTARLGKGDNDVFIHNSVSGKHLQLRDSGALQYSGTDVILASHFTGTKNTNGYIKLPNGLIIQWGSLNMTCTTGGTTVSSTVTFPVKFSSACYQIVTAVAGGVPHICSTSASDYSTSNFKYHLNRTNTTQTSCRWIAIGS